jgi:hypothetical protein
MDTPQNAVRKTPRLIVIGASGASPKRNEGRKCGLQTTTGLRKPLR